MARTIDGDALYQEFEAMGWYDNADRDLAEDKLLRMPTLAQPNEPLTPCDMCMFSPPSSSDGKPCCMCPAVSR